MKLTLHILGSFFLLSMSLMSFMMVAFWGGALSQANKRHLIPSADFLLYAIPTSCILAAILLWVVYLMKWPKIYYSLSLLPAPFFLFLAILMFMTFEK